MMGQAAQNSLLRFSNSAQLLTSFGRFADRRLSAEQCQIADFRADSRWIGKPHLRTLGTIGAQPNLGVSFIHSARGRSEEHTSELQSLMRISYAVFCLKKKKQIKTQKQNKKIRYHSLKENQAQNTRIDDINRTTDIHAR